MFDETKITFKEYKKTYYELRLNEHKKEYDDYDELTFIEKELEFFSNCYDSGLVILKEFQDPYDDYCRVTDYYDTLDEINGFVYNRKIYDALKLPNGQFLQKDHPTNGWNLETSKRFKITFDKILQFLKDKKNEILETELGFNTVNQTNTNTLNWQGTNLEFTELVKALIESNKLNPELKQNEIFKRLKQFFSIDEFNENDKIKEIVNRTITPTPFINTLEISLNNYRNNQLEKRKKK